MAGNAGQHRAVSAKVINVTSRDFCYWLQGYFELLPDDGKKGLTQHQTKQIQNHLKLVFRHEIDPSFDDTERQSIHDEDLGGDFPGQITC